MTANLRPASHTDIPLLVTLMTEFYAEAGYPLSAEAAARAFGALLSDPRLGRIWIIEADGKPAGHVVLTLAFSMEFGAMRGFVDDFYVRASQRNRGLGGAALDFVKRTCREAGVGSLSVETGPDGHPARRVYERAGFKDTGRGWLSQALGVPVHEA